LLLFLLVVEKGEEEVNIWMEPEDNIYIESSYSDGLSVSSDQEENIKAASLNRLVEWLTSDDKHGTCTNS
jgi:hypothetical protein